MCQCRVWIESGLTNFQVDSYQHLFQMFFVDVDTIRFSKEKS